MGGNIPKISRIKSIMQGGVKTDIEYTPLLEGSHLKGKGMIGFRKMARSSWYADGFENI